MHPLFLLAAVWSMLTLGIAHALPARPLYEPPDAPKTPTRTVGDFQGVPWLGNYNTLKRLYVFEADGTLSYKSAASKGALFKNRGSWKCDGTNITFEHTLGVKTIMEFRGVFKDQNTIVGVATYPLTNKKVEQTLQRTMP